MRTRSRLNRPRHLYGVRRRRVSFVLALAVAAAPAGGVEESPIRVDTLPPGNAHRITHRGPYPNLAQTYNRITEFMQEQGWMTSEADWMRYMPMWEEYMNDPETTPAAELVTYIYISPGRLKRLEQALGPLRSKQRRGSVRLWM